MCAAYGELVVVVAVVVFALVILVAAVSDVTGACLNVVIIATYDVCSIWRPFLWLSLWLLLLFPSLFSDAADACLYVVVIAIISTKHAEHPHRTLGLSARLVGRNGSHL